MRCIDLNTEVISYKLIPYAMIIWTPWRMPTILISEVASFQGVALMYIIGSK